MRRPVLSGLPVVRAVHRRDSPTHPPTAAEQDATRKAVTAYMKVSWTH